MKQRKFSLRVLYKMSVILVGGLGTHTHTHTCISGKSHCSEDYGIAESLPRWVYRKDMGVPVFSVIWEGSPFVKFEVFVSLGCSWN